ncbi:peptidase M48 [Rhodococcus sp. 06-1059B-a]|nr:M56 family metallopeptidase [Rhodococcus sp. 06-1059B-a]OZD70510.1 peptidase M48 [Rhodococcus sp. 06-1059B-a]
MIVALTLLMAAAIVAVTGRSWLGMLSRSAPPALALTAWIGSIAGVFFLVGSAVLVLMWPDHAPAEGVVELAIRCLGSLQHAAQPWVGESVAAVSFTVAAVAAVRLTRLGRRQLRDRTKVRDHHRDVLSILARTEPGHDRVMWLDHPLPLAYSIDGRPGYIVATAGLLECLDPEQQRAVILHERAHLRGQHHRIVAVCEILAKAFPLVPLFAAAPHAVRVLVELAADRAAAEQTSAEAVRTALATVSAADSARPRWALGVLGESTTERLRRLDVSTYSAKHTRPGTYAAMAMLPLVVPATMAVVALSAVSALACVLLQT